MSIAKSPVMTQHAPKVKVPDGLVWFRALTLDLWFAACLEHMHCLSIKFREVPTVGTSILQCPIDK